VGSRKHVHEGGATMARLGDRGLARDHAQLCSVIEVCQLVPQTDVSSSCFLGELVQSLRERGKIGTDAT
jgi:hypothetical protein